MKEKLEEVHYTAYRLRDEIIFLTNNVYGNDWLTSECKLEKDLSEEYTEIVKAKNARVFTPCN